MCKKFKIARDTILKYIDEKEEFTFKQLEDKIKEQEGAMRVAPNFNIREYLMTCEEQGMLRFDRYEDKYITK